MRRVSLRSLSPPRELPCSLSECPAHSYIPLKVDYTDLFDIMAFFAGDLDGRNGHDDLAKQIADNGKDYATRFWRYEDMEACASPPLFLLFFFARRGVALVLRRAWLTRPRSPDFFRLALEWARVSCAPLPLALSAGQAVSRAGTDS